MRSMTKAATQEGPIDALAKPSRWARVLKRFGIAGFAFFFIKGLLWLSVPALLTYLGLR